MSFSGVGPVPRSAKRLARSAHLHEVRDKPSNAVRERRRGSKDRGNDSREPRRYGNGNGRENEFSFARSDFVATPTSPLHDYSSKLSNGHVQYAKRRKPLYPLSYAGADGDESTEGDNWVDTDVDGSEVGTDI